MQLKKNNLILAVTSIIVALALAEFALQLLSLVSPTAHFLLLSPEAQNTIPDAKLVWRPNPDHPEHDPRGFRNTAAPAEAAIVALGDSQTYGTTVSPEQAWPQQLERLTQIKVYNMAYGGYGPVHYLILEQEAAALKPKLIILALYAGNDLVDSYLLVYDKQQYPELKSGDQDIIRAIAQTEERELLATKIDRLFLRGAKKPTGISQFLTEYSKLYNLLQLAERKYEAGYDASLSNDQRWEITKLEALQHKDYAQIFDNGNSRTVFTPNYRLAALDLSDPRIAEGYRISMQAIQLIRQQTQAENINFAVLLIPTKELVFKEAVYESSTDVPEIYATLLQNEELFWHKTKEFLSNQNIYFVDALPALREALQKGPQPYHELPDGHPNGIGHLAMAELLRLEIEKNLANYKETSFAK